MSDRQPESEAEYAAFDQIGDDYMADNITWGSVEVLPDGHRMFPLIKPYANALIGKIPIKTVWHQEHGLWAIADDSGREPQDTNDGVLFLDFSTPLGIGRKVGGSYGDTGSIPLVDTEGKQTRTPSDAATVFLLASEFNWGVNVRGIVFEIERRDRKDHE